jgi:hypothetical protein
MKHALTICYITARQEPMLGWMLDSLGSQIKSGEDVSVVVVDSSGRSNHIYADWVKVVSPKPTVWQGSYRLTKDEWWAASNARNTGICLCKTPWIALLDDRSILTPSWLQSIRHAMDDNYAVFGAYEKVHNLKVDNGFPMSMDFLPNASGKDPREVHVKKENLPVPFKCGGEWAFGCNLALPLEWALNVGGYDETCDGLSMEDCIFGLMLQNRGYELRYDTRMKILEDRTPSTLGTPMIRRDKGVSPNDKSHALLAMLKDRKTAMHGFDIREVRRKVLAGEPWPMPWGPEKDWYDGQLLKDMI